MRYYLKNNDIGVSVSTSFDCRTVMVSFERHPLTTGLGEMTPSEARTLAAMLNEQANKCDRAADDRRVRDVAFEAAIVADEATPA